MLELESGPKGWEIQRWEWSMCGKPTLEEQSYKFRHKNLSGVGLLGRKGKGLGGLLIMWFCLGLINYFLISKVEEEEELVGWEYGSVEKHLQMGGPGFNSKHCMVSGYFRNWGLNTNLETTLEHLWYWSIAPLGIALKQKQKQQQQKKPALAKREKQNKVGGIIS